MGSPNSQRKMIHFSTKLVDLGAHHFETPMCFWLSGPTCFSSTASRHIHVASWGASTEPGKTRVQKISWTSSYVFRVYSILIPCRLIDCTNFGTLPCTATLLISLELGEMCLFLFSSHCWFQSLQKKDAAASVSGCTA